MKAIRTVRDQSPTQRAWDALYRRAAETLKKRMEEHGSPRPTWMPVQDLCQVYRLPNEYKPMSGTRDDGGTWMIHMPETSQDKHDIPYSVGILISAGPEALGVLESHGVLPGDYVLFAPYAGEEQMESRIAEAIDKARDRGASPEEAAQVSQQVRDAEMAKKKLLRFQVPFIHGSVDLLERLYGETPTMELVREVNAKGGPEHVYVPVIENLI